MGRDATSLAVRPATAIVAQAAGASLPQYVTREQARAIINAAETMTHRLLLETIWQTGGRISEVLRLRPCDLVDAEGALSLPNLKQRDPRRVPRKLVYVSPDLLAQLRVLARDARVPWNGPFFRSQRSAGRPMSRQHAWRLITRYAAQAGVLLPTEDGRLEPAHGRAFRHGAAVHQVRSGVPLSEVQQQLGHARLDTTAIYTRLASAERRAMADRVEW